MSDARRFAATNDDGQLPPGAATEQSGATAIAATRKQPDYAPGTGSRRGGQVWLYGAAAALFALAWNLDVLGHSFFTDDHNLFKADAPYLRYYTFRAQRDLLIQFVETGRTPSDYPLFGHKEVRPFKVLPLAFANEISGLSPRALHAHCIVSFAVLCVLFYILLLTWGAPPLMAAFCCAVLVIHPTSPYFATWPAEMVYAWVACCAVVAMIAFRQGLRSTRPAPQIIWALLGLLFWILGLCMNEVILPMPIMWAYLWWHERENMRGPRTPTVLTLTAAVVVMIGYLWLYVATVRAGGEFSPGGERASSLAGRGFILLIAVYGFHVAEGILQQIVPYWNVSSIFALAVMVLFGLVVTLALWRDRLLRRTLAPAIVWCVVFSLPLFTFPGARIHAVVYLGSAVVIGVAAARIAGQAREQRSARQAEKPPSWRYWRSFASTVIAAVFLAALAHTNIQMKKHINDPNTVLHTRPGSLRMRGMEILKSRIFSSEPGQGERGS